MDDVQIDDNVARVLERLDKTTEDVVSIVYQPQALFKVRAVTRCSASLAGNLLRSALFSTSHQRSVGHDEAILSVQFSPDGTTLCSGSGDHTVRVWDLNTQTPQRTLKGHRGWILCIAWCPNGLKLASGSMDGDVR